MFRKFVFGILIALTLGGAYYLYHNNTTTITIEQATIQEKIDAVFPVSGEKKSVEYTFTDPIIKLTKSGLLRFDTQVSLQFQGREALGSVRLNGKPYYNNKDGSFYLKEVKVEDLTIVDIKALKGEDAVMNAIARLAKKKTKEVLGLSDDEVAEFIRGQGDMLKEKSQVLISEQVSRTPIYTLNPEDTKQWLTLTALEKIEVKDRQLLAELSWLNVIGKVLLFIFTGILSLLLAWGFLRSN